MAFQHLRAVRGLAEDFRRLGLDPKEVLEECNRSTAVDELSPSLMEDDLYRGRVICEMNEDHDNRKVLNENEEEDPEHKEGVEDYEDANFQQSTTPVSEGSHQIGKHEVWVEKENDEYVAYVDGNKILSRFPSEKDAVQGAKKFIKEKFSEDVENDEVTEALKRQRMKRMAPGDRAKARRVYRKNRSRIKKKLKKLRRKPSFKRRKARFKKMKGSKAAGARKRFVMASKEMGENLLKGIAEVTESSVLESLQGVQEFCLSALALMEADEYSHIGDTHVHGKDKNDLEHSDKDLTHVGEVIPEVEKEGNDLAKAGVADKDDHSHVGEDIEDALGRTSSMKKEDEELAKKFLEIAQSGVEEDFSDITEDIDDVLAGLKAHTISPQAAMKILKDVGAYIQGAMKRFHALADINPETYQDTKNKPDEVDESPIKPQDNEHMDTKGEPTQVKQDPVKPEAGLQHIGQGGKPAEAGHKPVSPDGGLGYVGTGKPDATSGTPVKADAVPHVGDAPYGKPSKEEPVGGDANEKTV